MEHTRGQVKAIKGRFNRGESSHEAWGTIKQISGYHIATIENICDVEDTSNAERIAALWNAADGMTTEEAVKALTNFHELQKAVENVLDVFDKMPKVGG